MSGPEVDYSKQIKSHLKSEFNHRQTSKQIMYNRVCWMYGMSNKRKIVWLQIVCLGLLIREITELISVFTLLLNHVLVTN
jgi:hypothetical protein